MHDPEARARLIEPAHAQATWSTEGRDVAAMERHATEGCSVCARALVNGREMAVLLATSAAESLPIDASRSPPHDLSRSARRGMLPEALRGRLRATMESRREAARDVSRSRSHVGSEGPGNAAGKGAPRILDPSATVAHRHILLPGEAARVREIDELLGTEPRPGEGSDRLLAQVARFVDFEILFVSIVRAERAVARVQRGLDERMASFRELRREMSYCTHCVSGEAPLVIENALAEPFFRGNKAATRFGIAAYVGVPLRSARGIVLGALCALSSRPRAIAPELVGVLEVFARRAVAEIERERTPELLRAIVERSSERADVYAEGFFRDLVAAEHARSASAERSALLAVRAARAEETEAVLGGLDEGETAGRLGASVVGVLLPGVGGEAATARLARLREAAGASVIGVAMAGDRAGAAGGWIARATGGLP